MAKPEKSLFPDEDLPCKKFKTKGSCILEQSGGNISVKKRSENPFKKQSDLSRRKPR